MRDFECLDLCCSSSVAGTSLWSPAEERTPPHTTNHNSLSYGSMERGKAPPVWDDTAYSSPGQNGSFITDEQLAYDKQRPESKMFEPFVLKESSGSSGGAGQLPDAGNLLESNLLHQLTGDDKNAEPAPYNNMLDQNLANFQATADLINQSQALLAQNQATLQAQQYKQVQQQRLNQHRAQQNAAIAEKQALLQSLLAKTVAQGHGVNTVGDIAVKREKIMEALKVQNDKLGHGDNFNIPQPRQVTTLQ